MIDSVRAQMRNVVEPAAPAPKAVTVRRSVARRGLLALGPLLGAVATGAVMYGLDVGGGSVPGAVIWIHSGIGLLPLLLVVYKVSSIGMANIRRAFSRDRLPELVSVVLGILSVPLLVTGLGLLLAPSTGSLFAYAHLISAAWWTGLLVWHLRRYVGASLAERWSGNVQQRLTGGASRSERRGMRISRSNVAMCAAKDVPGSLRVPS